MNLDKKIDYSIALLRKAESMSLRLDPENGFYLAFSGGKDSQALYHIAQMAGVKFKAHMNLTSVDPPEVIRFVKRQYIAQADDFDYAEVRDVKQAFVNGAEWMKKHFSWISVEERLPESKEKVLVLNRMKHHDKYFVSENIYINGNWAAKSAMYYEEIAWMPIPSFDEILEANRDVLERIKEKGD